MAVLTSKQKTLLANAFIEQGALVMCIGNPDTLTGAWPEPYSDSYPQPEISDTTEIINPIAYKLLGDGAVIDPVTQSTIAFAKVDNVNGTVEYNGSMYAITTSFSEAINNGYTSVYVKGTLIRTEVDPLIAYRIVGLFIQTIGIFDGETNVALPAAITSPGILTLISNRKPVYRDTDQSEVIELIIPF